MSLSWKSRNSILWLATAGVGALVWFGVPWTTKWLNSSDDAENKTVTNKSNPRPKAKSRTLDSPTVEQLEHASAVNLQRMNPPKPLPPPPKPTVVAEPPTPVPVILFQGTLLGTIQDSDPKYCFALLKGSDNRVQLVSQGQKIDSQTNSATVVAIETKEVTLRLGDQQQTLKAVEGP